MLTILYTLLVLSGIFLIVMILLQAGKGAGAGLSIGGGMSQTMFGGSGGRSFFMKLTGVVAGFFMLLCLILAKMSTTPSGQEYQGLMKGAAPVQPAAPIAAQPLKPDAPIAVQPAPAARPAPVEQKK